MRKVLILLSWPVLYHPLLDIPLPMAWLLHLWRPTTYFHIPKDRKALCKSAKVGHTNRPQEYTLTELTRFRYLRTTKRLTAIHATSTPLRSAYRESKSSGDERSTAHERHKAISGDIDTSAAHSPILQAWINHEWILEQWATCKQRQFSRKIYGHNEQQWQHRILWRTCIR